MRLVPYVDYAELCKKAHETGKDFLIIVHPKSEDGGEFQSHFLKMEGITNLPMAEITTNLQKEFKRLTSNGGFINSAVRVYPELPLEEAKKKINEQTDKIKASPNLNFCLD